MCVLSRCLEVIRCGAAMCTPGGMQCWALDAAVHGASFSGWGLDRRRLGAETCSKHYGGVLRHAVGHCRAGGPRKTQRQG